MEEGEENIGDSLDKALTACIQTQEVDQHSPTAPPPDIHTLGDRGVSWDWGSGREGSRVR